MYTDKIDFSHSSKLEELRLRAHKVITDVPHISYLTSMLLPSMYLNNARHLDLYINF